MLDKRSLMSYLLVFLACSIFYFYLYKKSENKKSKKFFRVIGCLSVVLAVIAALKVLVVFYFTGNL